MNRRCVLRDRALAEKKPQFLAVPYITESTSVLSAHKTIAMIVPLHVTKLDIKRAFKVDQNVDVQVTSLVRKGKRKRVRGVIGKRQNTKRVFVRFPKDFEMPEVQA
jgi:ribosomal protein L23